MQRVTVSAWPLRGAFEGGGVMGHCLFLRKGETHTAPSAGIPASDLAVGSTVKLMENGTAVEYLVVNQGIPGNSSLYDSSCNGTWLLRKALHSTRYWNSSNTNDYANSTINTWLNDTFFNSLGSVEQSAIRQVKIPYVNGTGSSAVASGANGLSAKVFLLSGYEVGVSGSGVNYIPADGAKLNYFNQNTGTDSKRIAYLNGSAIQWWLRSPFTESTRTAWFISGDGHPSSYNATSSYGARPALILPSNALFGTNDMILKGVG